MKRRSRTRDRYVPLIDSLEERSLMSGMHGFAERAIPSWSDTPSAHPAWMAPSPPPPSLTLDYQSGAATGPVAYSSLDGSSIDRQNESGNLPRPDGMPTFKLSPAMMMFGDANQSGSPSPRPSGLGFFGERHGGGWDRQSLSADRVEVGSNAIIVKALVVSYQSDETSMPDQTGASPAPDLSIRSVAGIPDGPTVALSSYPGDMRLAAWLTNKSIGISSGDRITQAPLPYKMMVRLNSDTSTNWMDTTRFGSVGVPIYATKLAQFLYAFNLPLTVIGLPPAVDTSIIVSAAGSTVGSIRQILGLEHLVAAQTGPALGIDGRLATPMVSPLHDLRFLQTGVVLANSNWTTPASWPVQAREDMGTASDPDALSPQAANPAAAPEQPISPLMAGLITEIPLLNDLVFGPLDVSQTLDQLASLDEAGWSFATSAPLLVTAGLLAVEVYRRRRGRKLSLGTTGFARDRRSSLHGFS